MSAATPPREAQVVSQITRWLTTLAPDVWFMKTHGTMYGKAGVPDIIGCANGIFFAIEVKRPGGKTTPLQETCIEAIAMANGWVGVAYNLEEAQSLVNQAMGVS